MTGVWEARDVWRDGVHAPWLCAPAPRCGAESPGDEPATCSREQLHPGRHLALAYDPLTEEDAPSLVIAAWPGAHRPVEGDMGWTPTRTTMDAPVRTIGRIPGRVPRQVMGVRPMRPVRLGMDAPFPRSWWIAVDADGVPAVWEPRPGGGRMLVVRREHAGGPIWSRLVECLPDRGACTGCTATPCREHEDPAGGTLTAGAR